MIMHCMNCGSDNDVSEFYAPLKPTDFGVEAGEKIILCADCRFKLLASPLQRRNQGARQPGRPSLGITQKISLTLSEEDWAWLDEQAKGNRSQLLRYLIGQEQSPEGRWSNNACLGYAILGAKKLGYDEEQIGKLIKAIYSEFDWKSVDQAKEVYNGSPY